MCTASFMVVDTYALHRYIYPAHCGERQRNGIIATQVGRNKAEMQKRPHSLRAWHSMARAQDVSLAYRLGHNHYLREALLALIRNGCCALPSTWVVKEKEPSSRPHTGVPALSYYHMNTGAAQKADNTSHVITWQTTAGCQLRSTFWGWL